MPPPMICGRLGDPLVKIWHVGPGCPELEQTFVVVKPPTGKLNDCADEVAGHASTIPMDSPIAAKTERAFLFMITPIRESRPGRSDRALCQNLEIGTMTYQIRSQY